MVFGMKIWGSFLFHLCTRSDVFFCLFSNQDPAVVSAAVEAKMQHVMVSRVGADLIQYLLCVLFVMSAYLQIWVSEQDQDFKKWIGPPLKGRNISLAK